MLPGVQYKYYTVLSRQCVQCACSACSSSLVTTPLKQLYTMIICYNNAGVPKDEFTRVLQGIITSAQANAGRFSCHYFSSVSTAALNANLRMCYCLNADVVLVLLMFDNTVTTKHCMLTGNYWCVHCCHCCSHMHYTMHTTCYTPPPTTTTLLQLNSTVNRSCACRQQYAVCNFN
jgi:hypothetical protein